MKKNTIYFLESGADNLPKKWRNYISEEMSSEEIEYLLNFCRRRHNDNHKDFRISEHSDIELVFNDSTLEPHQIKIKFKLEHNDDDITIDFEKTEIIERVSHF